jgi:hypothetical protein
MSKSFTNWLNKTMTAEIATTLGSDEPRDAYEKALFETGLKGDVNIETRLNVWYLFLI